MPATTDQYTLPEYVLSRVRYFDGQFLTDEDFIADQNHHIDRMRRHERLLHASGVTAGLDVTITANGRTVVIAPGSAVDDQGRQILLAAAQSISVDASWQGTMCVEIAYVELGTNASEDGSFTRFSLSASPVAVRAAPSPGAVQLGQLVVSGGVATSVTITGRTYAGVRLPGPATAGGGGTLRSLAEGGWAGLQGHLSVDGMVSVGAGLRVGTPDPKKAAPLIAARVTDTNPDDSAEGSDLVLFQGSGGTELNTITLRAPAIRLQTYSGGVTGIDDAGGSNDRVYIDSNGNIGIGTTSPAGYLVNVAGPMRAGVVSGPASDYVKAQASLSGGGAVTWANGRLKWTVRFVHFGIENDTTFPGGYVEIMPPTQNIPAACVYNNVERSVTADGVQLYSWEVLWVVHEPGANATNLTFRITHANASGAPYSVPGNWVFLAAVNGEDNTVKLGTGAILAAKGTYSKGSSMPKGTVVMWYGASDTIPDGWALCDGKNGTPNLTDRFVVAAGHDYALGNTGGLAAVSLAENQMPAHAHSGNTSTVGDHTHLVPFDDDEGGAVDTIATAKTADHVRSARPNFDVPTKAAGSHSHSFTTSTTGGGNSHENRPPYFALFFIIKL
ncbi:Phage tail fiber protein [Minicystis rosea]|nr:Phage tail fiber protein [Minicystis rosea]